MRDIDSRNFPRLAKERARPWLRVSLALVWLACLACQTAVVPERVALTNALRTRYELTETELRALQYYLSERVVLERVVTDGIRRVERGRLVVRGETVIQQIVIERGTPGVVEPDAALAKGPNAHAIPVSFQPGAPLTFSARLPSGSYFLAPPKGQGLFGEFLASLGGAPRAKVAFAGASWRLAAGREAHLLVERDAVGNLARERRRLRGVRLPDEQ